MAGWARADGATADAAEGYLRTDGRARSLALSPALLDRDASGIGGVTGARAEVVPSCNGEAAREGGDARWASLGIGECGAGGGFARPPRERSSPEVEGAPARGGGVDDTRRAASGGTERRAECREEIDASESQSVLIPTSLPYLLVSPGSDDASESELPPTSLLAGLRGGTGLGAFSPTGIRRKPMAG